MRIRYSDRAQLAVLHATQEAKRLGHDHVGTEHILLGLMDVGEGAAVQVMSNFGVDLSRVRREVGKIVGTGDTAVVADDIPFTPQAKTLLHYAEEAARHLGHSLLGTGHLLIGILSENEGVAAQVLENLGLHLGAVRDEVLNVLGRKT
jgi:ATP-dependent Clp protease ATP-binding subunit ClpC